MYKQVCVEPNRLFCWSVSSLLKIFTSLHRFWRIAFLWAPSRNFGLKITFSTAGKNGKLLYLGAARRPRSEGSETSYIILWTLFMAVKWAEFVEFVPAQFHVWAELHVHAVVNFQGQRWLLGSDILGFLSLALSSGCILCVERQLICGPVLLRKIAGARVTPLIAVIYFLKTWISPDSSGVWALGGDGSSCVFCEVRQEPCGAPTSLQSLQTWKICSSLFIYYFRNRSLERELFLVDEDVEFASVGDKDLYQQRENHACLNC